MTCRLAAIGAVLDTAALLEPVEVCTLEAIHLASALALGDDLDAGVNYDPRMADAATALGLHVIAPA